MTKFYRICAALFASLVISGVAMAGAGPAASADGIWRDVNQASIATRGVRVTRPDDFRTVALNDARLAAILATAPHEKEGGSGVVLSLPMPDGGFQRFEIFESPVMPEALSKKYPEIRTYAGQGIDDPVAWVRLDRTPLGFHAMLRGQDGTTFIDPYQIVNGRSAGDEYLSYYKHRYPRPDGSAWQCGIHELDDGKSGAPKASPMPQANRTPTGSELRTYRAAIATTGEYTSFHGGTVNAGLAAVVTALNRVTGIYQTELAIRMELIPNNDQLIFTNSATDGYSNFNGVAMLGQNQSKLDSVIGSANYDIGHVFSTGGGGIAGLGVVCRAGNKARGVTGLGSPIGDPFYVDFVAHEIGHQFGSNHTFNGTAGSCGGGNRNGGTAYEPGSGSTIMAYAGICSSHNIANFSDDHFHTSSHNEIVSYSQFSFGNNCPVITNTGNSAPFVEAGAGFTVPISTPLRLIGAGNDSDGHSLVYRWEQFDLGPGGSPQAPTGNAPLFRSFPAVSTPERFLPRLTDIFNDSQTIGEILPSYTRNMTFRLTALDQQTGGGGVDHDDVTHTVTDQAGPFEITSQNTSTTWTAGTMETVTWDVANTDAAPVNCSSVDIFLSTDFTNFTNLIAAITPNDGSHTFVVPEIPTNVGRILVQCSDNIFLDINNGNITIEEAANPDFSVVATPDPLQVCAPDDGVISAEVFSIGGFNGPVTFSVTGEPAGTTVNISPNPLNPTPGVSTITIGNTGAAAGGTYALNIDGSGTPGLRGDSIDLEITEGLAAMPVTTSPADGAANVEQSPMLVWDPAAGAASYLVEIATDAGFGNIVYSAVENGTSHQVGAVLGNSQEYFWRVSAQNFCGDVPSASSMFTVIAAPVLLCATPFAAIPDNTGVDVISDLNVFNSGSVVDVNVFIDATHSYVGDLQFELTNQTSGTTVALIDRPGEPALGPDGCSANDILATLDDEAASPAEDECAVPIAISGQFTPTGVLADFDGESITGTWTMTARDVVTDDTGSLNAWCLEVVIGPEIADTDMDGVPDNIDNCIFVANPDQSDPDGDGHGRRCDGDFNQSCTVNALDLGIFKSRFFTADPDANHDGLGVVNAVDLGLFKTLFFAPMENISPPGALCSP